MLSQKENTTSSNQLSQSASAAPPLGESLCIQPQSTRALDSGCAALGCTIKLTQKLQRKKSLTRPVPEHVPQHLLKPTTTPHILWLCHPHYAQFFRMPREMTNATAPPTSPDDKVWLDIFFSWYTISCIEIRPLVVRAFSAARLGGINPFFSNIF
jgi:hypothetical protein